MIVQVAVPLVRGAGLGPAQAAPTGVPAGNVQVTEPDGTMHMPEATVAVKVMELPVGAVATGELVVVTEGVPWLITTVSSDPGPALVVSDEVPVHLLSPLYPATAV